MFNVNIDMHNINLILFGGVLIAGLVGGEIVRRLVIFPQLLGYLLVGIILGPKVLNLITVPMLEMAEIYVDICFGVILFELGKNISIKSIINDPWLLFGGLISCVLCFAFIFIAMSALDFGPAKSALVAIIGITTSPAVIYMVARELNADGPIVRRVKSLVAINNVIGILAFVTILPYLNYRFSIDGSSIWLQPMYILIGSVGLSILAFIVTFISSMLIGNRESRQFILTAAIIALQIGLCYIFDFSIIISLLFYGICIKNLNYKNYILRIDFGYIEDLFFLMLFVLIGSNLSWFGVDKYWISVCAVLVARAFAQILAIYFSSHKSGFTQWQSFLISMAMVPISVSALGISQTASKLYPEFGAQISQVIILLLLVTGFIGPILTQWSFKMSESKSIN